jgi:EAL domain-containing protein (putative c-di-GMP-specific phosphodiesterase class I)
VDRFDRKSWQDWRRRNQAIVAAVEKALRQDRLLLAFQPVVCAATGRIDYFECLLRLRDEERGLVACGQFIEATEQAGLIDRHVVRKVADELQAHAEVRLGLNVSGLTACDREWLRSAIALLRRRPDLARRLVIEITETATLDNLEESVRFVDALRDIGCRVALDDFGAGHTSLRHLQVLAVDTVKIDGSLVRSLPLSLENRVFLRHLLGLARGFGLRTVGECVETAEEAALLRAEGIGFLQGFHCGRPTIERCWLGETAGDRSACE